MPTTALNYYDILGVSQTANEAEIRRAFREKIIKFHPDHNKAPDATKRTIEITEAYEVLKDSSARAAYDRILKADQRTTQNEKGRFNQAQQSARHKAQAQADKSMEEVLSSIYEAVRKTGKTIVSGDAQYVTAFDYLRSGFIGIFLVIAIILSFTGVLTLPAIAFIWLIYSGITKGEKSIGLGRFLGGTLAVGLLIVVGLGLLILSIL